MDAEDREGTPHGPSSVLAQSSLPTSGEVRFGRYVFRYRGRGPAPAADVACIAGQVHVLDHVARMLLVEASSSQVARLVAALPRWLATEERTFTVGERTTESSNE